MLAPLSLAMPLTVGYVGLKRVPAGRGVPAPPGINKLGSSQRKTGSGGGYPIHLGGATYTRGQPLGHGRQSSYGLPSEYGFAPGYGPPPGFALREPGMGYDPEEGLPVPLFGYGEEEGRGSSLQGAYEPLQARVDYGYPTGPTGRQVCCISCTNSYTL